MAHTTRSTRPRIFARFFGLLLAALLLAAVGGLTPRPLFAQATFGLVFSPSTIGPGSISTATFTISNGSGSPVSDMAFTNIFPAGVTIASPADATTSCLDGTVSAPAGGTTLTFSDGKLAAGQSCTVSVNVTSSTPGTHMNVSGDLTSSSGNSGTATADLTVATDRPGFSKSFAPSSVSKGGRSTLTFTIDNSANGQQRFSLTFSDNLPAGMEVANPANASTNCTGGSISATPGASALSFSDGTISAGATCTVVISVIATGSGNLGNLSGELTSLAPSFQTLSSGKAGAVLTSTITDLHLQKAFTDDPTPPGGTATLEFSITNFDRNFSATDVEFTDDLAAALSGLAVTGALPTDPCGAGSTLSGTTTLTLSGGTLAAGASCTFSVSVLVPGGAAPGSYTNTTGAVNGTVDGSPVVGNMASDDLFVEPVPVLTKEFVTNPVGAGDDMTIRFTITNVSTTSAATDVTFLDELTDGSSDSPPDTTSGFLPFPVTVTSPSLPAAVCNGTLSLVSRGTDRQALQLTGGSLAAAGSAGDSCTFDVAVTIPVGFAAGTYTNTTEEPSATVDGTTRTGQPASDDIEIVAAPTLTKEFIDDPVLPGDTVTLQFTLSHSEFASADATGITFTDDLTATLSGLAATGLPLTDLCGTGNGTLTGSALDTFLTFSGATLAPGEDCTFSVSLDVPAGAAYGSHTNETSDVTATVSGVTATGNPAEDDLQIPGLAFSKEFLTNPVIAGETITLRFTIENLTPAGTGDDATITFFTDNLSAALSGLAATGGSTFDDCGGTLSGTTFLTYVGGSVLAGQTCTIEVPLLVPAAAADGDYRNTTSNLSATQGGSPVSADPATDLLTVNSTLLQLEKSFTDDPVAPGDTVTLAFTLTNLSAAEAASAIAFTDDLDAAMSGLVATGLPASACGGTVDGIPDAGTIDFSGGSLSAGGSCNFSVVLQVPSGPPSSSSFVNTTSAVAGTISGLPVNGSAASDTLVVDVLSIEKSIAGPLYPGVDATLVFTLTSVDTVNTASSLNFQDDLDAFLPGTVALGLPATDICGSGSSISGTSLLSFSDGQLAPSASCIFSVTVKTSRSAGPGVYTNQTTNLTQSGLRVADAATASVTVGDASCYATPDDGATIYAGTDSLPVQTAVEHLGAAGGTVKVAGSCAGVQERASLLQTVYISAPVTIIGGFVPTATLSSWTQTPDADANPTILDAQGGGRVVYIDSDAIVTLKNLRITRGWIDDTDGGGIFAHSSTSTTISNSLIYENTANGGDGGGIFSVNALTVTNSFVYSNTAVADGSGDFGDGGGISLLGDLFIDNTAIYTNTSDDDGGGIDNDGPYALIQNSQIYSNFAAGSGGGLDADGATEIINTYILTNTADGGDGGGIKASSPLSISNSYLRNNSADADGGAVYVSAGDWANISDSEMTDNSADFGGGIASRSPFTVTSSLIQDNRANFEGGGLLFDDTLVMTDTQVLSNTATIGLGGGLTSYGFASIENSTFNYNSAPTGGGLAVEFGELSLTSSTVQSNAATAIGGGVSITDTAAATITGSTLRDNSAERGGALHNGGAGSVTVHSSQVISNSAGASGGGLYNLGSGSAITLTNSSSVESNSAAVNGGGIFNTGGSVSISNSALSDNWVTAGSGGGLWNEAAGSVTIDAGSILSNTATGDGGGVANLDAGSAVTLTNGSLVQANSAADGGGISNASTGAVTVDGSRVLSNTATSGGGGLRNAGAGSVMILANSSTVSYNSADDGGGILNELAGQVSVNASSILSNTATGVGGGIASLDTGSAITLTNGSLVQANSATFGGGVNNSSMSAATLDGVTVLSNTATDNGGGLRNVGAGSAMTLTNSSTVSYNSADDGGGLLNSGRARIDNSQIVTNTATGDGGGVINYEGRIDVIQSLLSGNMATSGAGGGLTNGGTNAVVLIDDSQLTFNSAGGGNGGGALYSDGSGGTPDSVEIRDSLLQENTSSGNAGAAVTVISTGYFTMTGSSVLTNTMTGSAVPGAIYSQADFAEVTGNCIFDNSDTAVQHFVSADTMNATGNWWGHASGPSGDGPGVGDSVGGNVDFSGFLTSPILGCPTFGDPDLAITKSASAGSVLPGQPITFTLSFTNTGSRFGRSVTISDSVPASIFVSDVVSSTTGGLSIAQSGNEPDFAWQIDDGAGRVAVDAGGVITLTGVISPLLNADAVLTNTATLTTPVDSTAGNDLSSAVVNLTVPRVSFSPAAYTVDEGAGTQTITTTLDSVNPFADVNVTAASSDGSAVAPADYTAVNQTVTIPAGSQEMTYTLSIVDDSLDELSEILTNTLSAPTGAALGSTNEAAVTITDNDPTPTLSIADVTIDEGDGTATFTVTLSAVSGLEVSFDYATSDGTATEGSDYTAASGTLTITAGSTEISFIVAITDDAIDENSETFTATLSSPVNATLADGEAIGTITDNDPTPTLSIADVTVDEGDGTATFTVTLSAVSGLEVSFDYATSDGTATAGSDYTAASGTLTITAGSTEISFIVAITDDAIDENSETFTATLSSPVNATLADGEATGTITDNDPTPTLSIADVTVDEGEGTATFTVTLSAVSGLDVTVNYATSDNSATAGNDYTAASGTLTITAGSTETSFIVSITDDAIDENAETFTATLSSPVNATLADGEVTGTITDNDATPTLSIADVTVDEGAGTATLTITLSAVSGLDVTVGYATSDNSATAGNDYTAASGTLTITVGSTETSFIVSITDDTIDENAETFTATLSSPVNATLADGEATGTITDNDAPPTLSIDDVTVDEGAGTAIFTVTLSAASGLDVTVGYATSDNSATAGNDYTAASGTLTITVGSTETSFIVSITDDTIDENAETFTATLSSPVNATLADGEATGTITDNDAPPTLSIDDVTVDEGAGTAIFTVTLSAASGLDVTVGYATSDNSATAGNDYTAASGTLTITAGSTETSFIVAITDDVIDENTETFTATLSSPTNATLADGEATGTITDNDATPTLSIADVTVDEGAGTATFTVTLSAVSGLDVTVGYATSDDTATAGSDYTSTSGTASIPAGSTTDTFTVAITDDVIDENSETFTATLSSPVNATVADGEATGTITDNDATPTLSIADVTVDEGAGTATFTVTLSAVSGLDVTVSYATSDDTATAGSDYTSTSGTASIPAGSTTDTFTVAITDDVIDENTETFTATLSSPTNATLADG